MSASEASEKDTIWLELADSEDSERVLYYHIKEDRVQWEPKPEYGVEVFESNKHGSLKVLANVVSRTLSYREFLDLD